MNGAFVSRALGPCLPQTGLFRGPNVRCVCVNARRIRKTLDEAVEEAPTLAADAVSTKPKRTQKPSEAADDVTETPSVVEAEAVAPASRSRRRKTVDSNNEIETSEQPAEAKPARRSRKKAADAEAEPSTTASEITDGPAPVEAAGAAEADAKPKRASRKKATAIAAEGDVDATGGTEPKPKAKRTSKKSKEPDLPPDVVSTRGRRKVESSAAEEASLTAVAPSPPAPTAAALAAKRRSVRAGGAKRAAASGAPDPMQSSLADLVIQRNDAGEVVSINRAALGQGRKMWYAIGVVGGLERKWAESLRQKLATSDTTAVDPDTGSQVPLSALIEAWVPTRKDWVMSKKTGNVIQRDVVHKEGWVYVKAPLDEQVVRVVEEVYGFQQWRGEQDHFFDDVGAVKLITPLSEGALEEIRVWESTPVGDSIDPEKKEAMAREMFGEAGGDVLGQSERVEDREGELELDENGRAVFRNANYTGGRQNPSNWYSGSGGSGGAAAEESEEAVSLDGRGNEMTYAPEPEPRRDRRQRPPRETRGSDRDWAGDRGPRGQWGQQQREWGRDGAAEGPGGRFREPARGGAGGGGSFTSSAPPPPTERAPSRAGVRPSAAAPTPSLPRAAATRASSGWDLKFQDELDELDELDEPARPAAAAGRTSGAAPASKKTSSPPPPPPSRGRADAEGDDGHVGNVDELDNDDDDGLGRIEGPSGGLDMDDWFASALSEKPATRGGAAATATAGAAAAAPGRRGRQASGFDKFVDPALDDEAGANELDRMEGGYLDDAELGFGKGGDFADFDFDLGGGDGFGGGAGGGWGQRGGGAAAGKRGAQSRQQPDGGRRSGGRGGAALDDDLGFDDLAFDDFDFEANGPSTSRRGGGGGGATGDFLGDFADLDDDLWGDMGTSGGRRGGAAARGGGSYGSAAGGKLGKAGGAAGDDLFGAGGDDDWGYIGGDDGGGFGADFGGMDPFGMDADPWGGGGGGGGGGYSRQKRTDGGRTGGYQSGGGRGGSRSGGGGGGYMSGSGPSYDDDPAGAPASASPSADRQTQGTGGQGGQGYRDGGGGGNWRQGGRNNNSWQQGGSGYGNRGYQGGGGGGGGRYQSGGGGGRYQGGNRGGSSGGGGGYEQGYRGDRRDYRSGGGGGGYGQQQNRQDGDWNSGREGGWQDRRGGSGRGGGYGRGGYGNGGKSSDGAAEPTQGTPAEP